MRIPELLVQYSWSHEHVFSFVVVIVFVCGQVCETVDYEVTGTMMMMMMTTMRARFEHVELAENILFIRMQFFLFLGAD